MISLDSEVLMRQRVITSKDSHQKMTEVAGGCQAVACDGLRIRGLKLAGARPGEDFGSF